MKEYQDICISGYIEVIVGKSFSKTQSPKRFGWVQSVDDKSQRRVMNVLRHQGVQQNQQITFLLDGADNVREMQYLMHPEAEPILDWFHFNFTPTFKLAPWLL